jgi:hypothetical protein
MGGSLAGPQGLQVENVCGPAEMLLALIKRAPKARSQPRGVWGHAPPEIFEIIGAIWCILVHFKTIRLDILNCVFYIDYGKLKKIKLTTVYFLFTLSQNQQCL